MFLILLSCNASEKKDNIVEKGAFAQKKEITVPKKAITDKTMSIFFDKYPVLELPKTFKWNNAEEGKIMMSKAFDAGDRSKICQSDIKCSEDEQLFYVHKYVLESGHFALLTFIVGDFSERLILTIHDKSEKMLSSELLNMSSEEYDYGYSSYLSKSFKIYRSKMFYKAGTTEMEVDSEEEFGITDTGLIEKVN